jgi:hypothetical protein
VPQSKRRQDESSGGWEYLEERKQAQDRQRTGNFDPPGQGDSLDGRDVAPAAAGGRSEMRQQGVGGRQREMGRPREEPVQGGLSDRARRRVGGNAGGNEVDARSGWWVI